MKQIRKTESFPVGIKSYALILALIWSAIVAASLTWNLHQMRQGTFDLARIQARASFMKDVIYRRWNADHGSVYVPVTDKTRPNPYLKVSERDITTHSGIALTMINPAYMTRQVHELADKKYGIRSHITSLNPIRSANAPDPWEIRALASFQRGAKEVASVEKVKDSVCMRLMRPLITEKGCLKCHAAQGYKLGDIRGGISVSVPMSPLWAIERSRVLILSLGYGLIYLVGLAGLGLVASRLSRQVVKRKKAEKKLKKRTNDLSERVKELNCLYSISELVERQGIPLEEIIQGTVDLIPAACRYPEATCGRIIIGDQEFKTKNFRKTDWRQAFDIIIHGELNGIVEIYYLEEKPTCHEGPFLKEEKTLIKTIAQRLGRITEWKRAEKEIRCLKEKYEDLYCNAPAMYLSLYINGTIIECNNAVLDRLGYAKKEIIGKHMTTFLTEKSIAGFKEDFPKLIKTGKLMGLERQLIAKSGEIVDAQMCVTGEYNEQSELIKTRASFEDITILKRAEEHIHSLTHALINAHESERQMISRELHDQIAQDLSTLKIAFDTLVYNRTDVSLEESQKAAGFSEIFKNTIAAVRDLSYNLRPPLLDEMGLAEAISNFCESFSQAHGVNVHFNSAGMEKLRLNFETEINLYRLVQEGLNNIKKHAEAADAFVKLIAASPNIILRIEDNGRGFDVERRLEAPINEKRMGLRSMEERTRLLGGKMTVKSRPLKGTKVLIKIPQKKGKNETKNNTGRR